MNFSNVMTGISTGAGLFSAIANPFLQGRQNRQNLKMMREQNAFNAQEAQKNRDWQLQMWNMNNEYNDPSAWRDRMDAAGFNAWNYNGGNQSSAMSGAQASAAGMPSLAAPQIDSNPFITAANSFAQMRIADRGMRVTEAQSPYQMNLWDAQARNTDTQSWYTRNYQAPLTFEQSLNATLQRHVMGAQLQNVMASTAFTNIQTLIAGTELSFLPQEKMVSLANQVAGAIAMMEQGRLTRQQVKESIARTLHTYALAAGVEIQNRILDETADNVIKYQNAFNALGAADFQHQLDYGIYSYKNNALKLGYERDAVRAQTSKEYADYLGGYYKWANKYSKYNQKQSWSADFLGKGFSQNYEQNYSPIAGPSW